MGRNRYHSYDPAPPKLLPTGPYYQDDELSDVRYVFVVIFPSPFHVEHGYRQCTHVVLVVFQTLFGVHIPKRYQM